MHKQLLILILAGWPALAADLKFTVAGLQVVPDRWDKQANFAKLEQYSRKAAALGAQVVITPEGFLEGYVANIKANNGLTREEYLKVGEKIDGALLSQVANLARELKIYLVVGFAEKRERQMYNSTVVFAPEGKVLLRYAKTHTEMNDEPFNTKGEELPITPTPLGRWGILICFDRQIPEAARILALKGAQFLLVPSYGGFGEMNDIMMRVRAYENGVYLAFVHPKRCLFVDPAGKVIASSKGQGDMLVTADITLDDRIGKGPIQFRRPELYGEISKQ